jgi:hypothetical protein
VYYLLTIDIDLSALERELKKRAAELLLLSVLEARPRHGYELGKLIETQSCCSIASKSAAGSRGRGSRRRASAGAASIGGRGDVRPADRLRSGSIRSGTRNRQTHGTALSKGYSVAAKSPRHLQRIERHPNWRGRNSSLTLRMAVQYVLR